MAEETIGGAGIESGNQALGAMGAADISRQGQIGATEIQAAAQRAIAELTNQTQRFGIDSTNSANRYQADRTLQGQTYSADRGYQAANYGADQAAASSRYGADQTLRGTALTSDANRYAATTQLQGIRYNSDAETARQNSRLNYLTGRTNQFMPYFQQLMGSTAAAGRGVQPSGPAPASGPQITTGGVWSPAQIQQQVNASAATNNVQAGTDLRAQQRTAASQGYGARSPLLAALAAMTSGQRMASDADQSRQINWNAAQGNAQQQLASQTANEAAYSHRQGESIDREKNSVARQGSLLQALSSLMNVNI